MRVRRLRATAFRCHARLDCELAEGLTAIAGPNGSGKTSIVEAIHFGLLAWSPRTSDEQRLVQIGQEVTRVEVDAELGGAPLAVAVGFEPGRPKHITLDGVAEPSADALARRFAVLVFTPDRLAVVKGAPAVRRRYLDRAVVRLWPRYGRIAADYARVLSQRNHLLRRVRAGYAPADEIAAWDGQVAQLGAEVRGARMRLVERLAGPFALHLAELGGAPGEVALRYEADGPADAEGLAAALAAQRARDIERCTTGSGPHHDDLAFLDGDRDLRAFGSQGEQRSGVLALLLAEADLIAETRDLRPLLLLDDVASELDADRRAHLLGAVTARGQAVVTTTDSADVSAFCDALLEIGPAGVAAA